MEVTVKPRFAPSAPNFSTGTYAATMPASITSTPLVLIDRPREGPEPVSRRAKLSELSRYLHCSVIGTCVSTSELRHILGKAAIAVDGASDHELHGRGVTTAGEPGVASKLLHKALDKRHRQAINRFAKAKSDEEVRSLWRDAVKSGDIPGAYWAALTHPATSDDLVRLMFGEVHMLSHLVGAANRADIQRLSALEAENAELQEKLRRQQAQLREGITARDTRINELSRLVARRIADDPHAGRAEAGPSEHAALNSLIADLERRLGAERRHRSAIEARLERIIESVRHEQQARKIAETRAVRLCEELEALEAGSSLYGADAHADAASLHVEGLTILYVGGRPQQHSRFREIGLQCGADVLCHDGGIEERYGLLAGLVSRADTVMFPVDCVSHEAVATVKRLCRQAAKSFVPLRSSGISSFLAALKRIATAQEGKSLPPTPAQRQD